MPNKTRFKRKRRFIDKKQQVRFAIEITLYSLIVPVAILLLAAGDYFSTSMLGGTEESIHPLLREVLTLFSHYWWGAILAVVAIAYVSIWFSHKIFGPIHRFEISLEQKRSNPQEWGEFPTSQSGLLPRIFENSRRVHQQNSRWR